MKKRKVKLLLPKNVDKNKFSDGVKTFTCAFDHRASEDVYSTVEKFRKEVFPEIGDEDLRVEFVRNKTSLAEIVNLHNAEEIKRRSSIEEMLEKINSGKHVKMPDGLPNVKVVKTKLGELVCFDGHHSMLAYMFSGKRYLHQLPSLVISDPAEKGLEDEEIYPFFGDHAKKLRGTDWRNYTISWTNPPERQLEERKQEDMGELFSALGRG
ncbi:hypothetical protein K9M78_08645 [Candidatus Bipolaricaulota bacterium]|nr:hypothetical protein [Candidatus Bipolaricaulota bacterium]